MQIKAFFHEQTWTLTYLVFDPVSKDAVVIDSVMDFDPVSWKTYTRFADEIDRFVREHGLTVHWLMDTHAHADHLTGMGVLKERWGAKTAMGAATITVQEVFSELFDLGPEFKADGSQWDRLLADGDRLQAGTVTVTALATPGHTPACTSYLIEDMVFTGDALFMPDFGTGRCDFPKGDARTLYRSVTRKLYSLPDDTRVFVGHDYQPGGRELRYQTTIGESKTHNTHLTEKTPEEAYVEFRTGRDKKLPPPKLIFQSLQVNINGGILPEPKANGLRYLKIPLGVF